MKRNIDLNDISDGRLYTANDMVKADCFDCQGCSNCCRGMGQSIVLDPLDVNRLCVGLNSSFDELLKDKIELNVVDGLTLPNMKMNDACGFLDTNGRCSIHEYRPGICRLFPLGRFYENDDFKYFIQVHECPVKNKGKVKVKKWLDTPDLKKYEKYINDWHGFLVTCRESLEQLNEEQTSILNLLILKTFYKDTFHEQYCDKNDNKCDDKINKNCEDRSYNNEEFYDDFYTMFYNKLKSVKELLGIE